MGKTFWETILRSSVILPNYQSEKNRMIKYRGHRLRDKQIWFCPLVCSATLGKLFDFRFIYWENNVCSNGHTILLRISNQSNKIMIFTCFEIDQDFKYPSILCRSTVLVTTIRVDLELNSAHPGNKFQDLGGMMGVWITEHVCNAFSVLRKSRCGNCKK